MAKKLYVGNLSFNVTQGELEELFGAIGEVSSVNIITDRMTGRPRGFAFVEMENAEKAIEELNGKELDGRALTVNEARPKKDSGGGGGGFGGGGGGGGRGGPRGGRGGDRW
jgi:RNA recognition motif-containing protein